MKFTSLLHHITEELLRASFFELNKQAASGIDGETWQDYAMEFKRRIKDLHGRIHCVWTTRAVGVALRG